MKISYDYSEFLQELREEIEDGILTTNDTIQILRAEKSREGYHPIIDWYYAPDKMEEDFEEYEDLELKIRHRVQYDTDKPRLIERKVRDVIAEMMEWDSII